VESSHLERVGEIKKKVRKEGPLVSHSPTSGKHESVILTITHPVENSGGKAFWREPLKTSVGRRCLLSFFLSSGNP
jgi:hypothetical protein